MIEAQKSCISRHSVLTDRNDYLFQKQLDIESRSRSFYPPDFTDDPCLSWQGLAYWISPRAVLHNNVSDRLFENALPCLDCPLPQRLGFLFRSFGSCAGTEKLKSVRIGTLATSIAKGLCRKVATTWVSRDKKFLMTCQLTSTAIFISHPHPNSPTMSLKILIVGIYEAFT
jgi:hypothetical protein